MSSAEDLTAFAHENIPFTRELGLRMLSSGPDEVAAEVEWTPERCTAGGLLHGGFLMAAVDSVGAVCAFNNLPEGAAGTSTIESKTNFMGAVRDGVVRVTAQPVHVGRTTVVVQTDAVDDRGRLISRSLQTQAVLYPS